MPHITFKLLVPVTFFILGACTFSSIGSNPDHCVNNGGNEYCGGRGYDLAFCSKGILGCPGNDSPQGDGCVASAPGQSCYSPCGEDSWGGNVSCDAGVSTSEAGGGTGAEISTGESSLLTSSTWSESGAVMDDEGSLSSSSTSLGVSSSSSDDGQPPMAGDPYSPCMLDADVACLPPYGQCYQYIDGYNFCTRTCVIDDVCPPPPDGNAEAICAVAISLCVLECTNDGSCPEGMGCEVAPFPGNPRRCVWPDQ